MLLEPTHLRRGLAGMLNSLATVLRIMALAGIVHAAPGTSDSGYLLAPEDRIAVRVLDLDEFDPRVLGPIQIDPDGNIRLPVIGRLRAAGLNIDQLEARIAGSLSNVMLDPHVTVAVTEFHSHPVSVLGAVKNPGVHQIVGQKTLFEVLSLAGGLSTDAGNTINITRRVDAGPLPLVGAERDPTGVFFVGKLNVRAAMEARSPGENIAVLPNDVITVPKADLIYVVGSVKRAGGFPLSEKEQISVLQAVSLAEGLDRSAGPKNARILRQSSSGGDRTEIPVNVQRILEGLAPDVALHANDILFIPTSAAKNVAYRALEAAIQMGTGVVIWR